MTLKTVHQLKTLYEIDDCLWLQETVTLLEQRKFDQLDLDNLIEELKDLGRERKYQVESFLEQIIRHLLLLEYWESEYERNYRHWRSEIVNFRTQMNKRMTTNFKNHLQQNLSIIYHQARKYVKEKSGLDIFPQECPYTLEQLCDENWFPQPFEDK
jgi:hypothetical protein